MGCADGGDAHAGAIRRSRMDLRAEARWNPDARVQEGRRREALFTQPAAAALPGSCRGYSRTAGSRCDSRRRSRVGSGQQRRLPRLRYPVARRPLGHVPAARRSTRIAAKLAVAPSAGPRSGTHGQQTLGTRVPRRMGRRDREASHVTVRTPAVASLAEDEVRGDRRSLSLADSRIRRAAASVLARCWSATSIGMISCLPARSVPASTRNYCWSCARVWTSSRSRNRRLRRP